MLEGTLHGGCRMEPPKRGRKKGAKIVNRVYSTKIRIEQRIVSLPSIRNMEMKSDKKHKRNCAYGVKALSRTENVLSSILCKGCESAIYLSAL